MILEQSFISQSLARGGNKISANILVTLFGSALIALLAQIAIPLPFTPVPITGQTLGVAMVALLWGRKRGVSAVIVYLVAGVVGLPVFAGGLSGLSVGPTIGYLIGMVFAAGVMGWLSDLGWTKSFAKTYLAAFIGSMVTFSLGLIVLSLFVPKEAVLAAGLWPFLPGDVVKTLIVCGIVRSVERTRA